MQMMTADDLVRRQRAADRSMVQLGITFNVYGDSQGRERIIPFDIVPRIVPRGMGMARARPEAADHRAQPVHRRSLPRSSVIRDGIVPEHVIATANGFRQQCIGLNPPRGIWCHITGTDLVRDSDGQYYVLEDNLRCPSGVSYVLQNRQLMKQTFPQLFELTVDPPGRRLLQPAARCAAVSCWTTRSARPRSRCSRPACYNSAYFEHSFLAQQMGIDLVEGRDLVVSDGFVYMRTTKGFERIDVLYRRIDDDFLDPQAFREDSMLGVPGLMEAYRAGRIALANAPGTGIADDKVMYAYVPRDHQVLSERRSDHPQRADVCLLGRKAAESRARQSRQARREAGQRIGRLRPDDRPARQPKPSTPTVPSKSKPTRATTSPSRR